jgi:hypothetical protein
VRLLRASPAAISALFQIELADDARFDLELTELLCRLCHGKGKLYLPTAVDCFTCHGSGLPEVMPTTDALRALALTRSIRMSW